MVETSTDPGDPGWYSHSERIDESRGEDVEVLNQQVSYSSLVKGSI